MSIPDTFEDRLQQSININVNVKKIIIFLVLKHRNPFIVY